VSASKNLVGFGKYNIAKAFANFMLGGSTPHGKVKEVFAELFQKNDR
jgi:hypothetical protein